MAEHANTTSRRRLLAGAPAALALAGAAAAGADALAAAPHPDADILALGERIRANRDEYEARTEPYYDDTPEPPENVARVRVLVNEGHRMAEELAEMQATTLAGLRVKAAVLMDYAALTNTDRPLWSNHDELMGWSLARDMLAGAAA